MTQTQPSPAPAPARTPPLGEEAAVHPTARIHDSHLGAWTEIGAGTSIAESSVGDYSYIVAGCSVIYATIGKFCSIAAQTRINPGNHPMWRPTQHHLTYRRVKYGLGEADDADFFQWRRDHHVTIGHDVWIGHGATVMPGITIGTGAVIGAGAVVTHDVEPYTIVAGVPARPIRPRFPEEIASALQRIAYWDWTRAELEERIDDLTMDVAAFCEKYG